MSDVYEKLRLKALEEFDKFDNNENVNKSLNRVLSNSSDETDYETWLTSSECFSNDHSAILTKMI